ncbi:MAG: hypothetical protein ACI4LD_08585 [Lentihominibacter sp.]
MKRIDDLKLVISFFAAVGAVCFAFANRYTVIGIIWVIEIVVALIIIIVTAKRKK